MNNNTQLVSVLEMKAGKRYVRVADKTDFKICPVTNKLFVRFFEYEWNEVLAPIHVNEKQFKETPEE